MLLDASADIRTEVARALFPPAMADFSTGTRYRELAPQLPGEKWQLLTVKDSGDGSSADRKETGGGYSYSRADLAAKRFLFWRVVGHFVELFEESLDADLRKSRLRIQLQGGSAVGSVDITETPASVVALFASSHAVYELTLPHPSDLADQRSVLADVSSQNLRSHPLSTTCGLAVGSCFSLDGNTVIGALPNSAGGTYAISWPLNGTFIQHELKQSSIMQKLWTGFLPSSVRSDGMSPADGAVAATILHFDKAAYVYVLCRDIKIRVWSWQGRECVATHDLTSFSADKLLSIKGAAPKLKKYVSADSDLAYIVVHLASGSSGKQLCVLEPSVDRSGRLGVRHVGTLYGGRDGDELSDFCVSSDCIWALWSDKLGKPVLRRATLGERVETWSDALLVSTSWTEDDIPSVDLEGRDPREAYIEHIFHPNRFSLQALAKAVQIFDKNKIDLTVFSSSPTLAKLRAAATLAVQRKVWEGAGEEQLADEDYYELQLNTWSKFYSYVLQYHEKAMLPLGVVTPSDKTACLVRCDSVSFLKPCDRADIFRNFPSEWTFAEVLEEGGGDDETVAARDLQLVAKCLAAVRTCFPNAGSFFAAGFLRQVSSLSVTLPTVARQAVTMLLQQQAEVIANDPSGAATDLLREVSSRLQNVRDLLTAFDALAKVLDMSQPYGFKAADDICTSDDDEGDERMDSSISIQTQCVAATYASAFGRRLLTSAVEAAALTRWETCCECLVLIAFVQRHTEQAGVHHVTVGRLEASLSKLSHLACCLYSIVWLSRTLKTASCFPQLAAGGIDLNAENLEGLSIADQSSFLANTSLAASLNVSRSSQTDSPAGDVTQLELFVREADDLSPALEDLDDAAAKRPHGGGSSTIDYSSLSSAAAECCRLAWPIAMRPTVAECLAAFGQFEALQQYCRLLNGWCRQNVHSRCFLLAKSYLAHNELTKALDSFAAAVPGLETELYLRDVLLRGCSSEEGHLVVLYYIRVIALLENISCWQLVTRVARLAVSAAAEAATRGGDSAALQDAAAMLWTKIFKYELELAHHKEAFDALLSNPDGDRKKDCLRQFVVTLCERGCIRELVCYPYDGLLDEVVRILESKARSVDLAVQSYYETLYALHVHHSNFRRAGTMMYEQALRLALEVPGLTSLQRQAKCLLAALNALRLVSPDYAWVVKPPPARLAMLPDAEAHSRSPKRTSADEQLPPERSDAGLRPVTVIELGDLEKEYALLSSRLKLIQREPAAGHTQGPTLAAPETSALLVTAGMFDDAIRLCQKFGLKLTNVYEGLAYRCVQLTGRAQAAGAKGDAAAQELGEWLTSCNELPVEHANLSIADQAWSLLRHYLAAYEEEGSPYHRSVAGKLLSMCFPLPDWLLVSYKSRNPPELLRLLLRYGLLEESAAFALEYIEALLGAGYESFGLPSFLHGTVQPCSVWLPYTAIDQLMCALQAAGPDDRRLQKAHDELKRKLKLYDERLRSVSQDVTRRAALQRVGGISSIGAGSRSAVEAPS